MAASRSKKGLLSTRRRAHDEGDEEDGQEDVLSETQSEGSGISDAEDLEHSDQSDNDESEEVQSTKQVLARPAEGTQAQATTETEDAVGEQVTPSVQATSATFKTTADTEAMMNGLKLEDGAQGDAVDFGDSADMEQQQVDEPAVPVASSQGETKSETLAQRRAREHEEYKQKREADPAFVPTRGGFFMHDQRNSNFGNNVQAGFGRGRGRGGPMNMVGAGR